MILGGNLVRDNFLYTKMCNSSEIQNQVIHPSKELTIIGYWSKNIEEDFIYTPLTKLIYLKTYNT